jgi:hypothetical protein
MPAPSAYSIPTDNISFRKNRVSLRVEEKKFFKQKNMHALKAKLPIQYTALDGVSPQSDELIGAHNRGSRLSGYIGGSSTSRYR